MSSETILIADDDDVTRKLLEHHLKKAGFSVLSAADGKQAMEAMSPMVAVALVDLAMPIAGGIECLRFAQRSFPDMQVMVISRSDAVRDAVEAMKEGATEYITKPIDPDELIARVKHAIKNNRLASENRTLKQALEAPLPAVSFWGNSKNTTRVIEQARKAAQLDSTVLLTGESGTGKTTLARLIHQIGKQANGPFVAVSCANLPRELVEAELFGHAKGAFTGAISDRPGKAELAHQGTLFLDEIGDLPLEIQPKLLTFLQDRVVQRIGSSQVKQIQVRIIAATNQDLDQMVNEGSFREDLYFRLNVLPIEIPALRDRLDDLEMFVINILQRIAKERGSPPFKIAAGTMERLREHRWSGNVRELENVLERATAFCTDNTVTPADLSLRVGKKSTTSASLAGMTLDEIQKRAIEETLAHCQGNKKAAAKMLGIDEKTIYNKMQRFGMTKSE